ncbi:MAG TPA: hypothetical protein VGC79_24575 [Polyangiaceae bacterium]
MFRQKDVVLLLLLAFALSAAKRQQSNQGGRELAPGWYWWLVRWSTDRADLETWLRYNRGKASVAKALGYTSDDNAILILHVNEPVIWSLPGWPTPAPNGVSTSLPELERAPKPGPVTSQDWRNLLTKLLNQGIDEVLAFDTKVQQWLDKVLR